jgi:hypothetical protein
MIRTGGCQCGAVRFKVEGDLGRASLCHCRMCQKAFAAPFAALVTVGKDQLAWTRGALRRFRSSNRVWRGFCQACGTPLTFEWNAAMIDLAVCAFDEPADIPIGAQLRVAAALPWVNNVAGLSIVDAAATDAHDASVVSNQHPDQDTSAWP